MFYCGPTVGTKCSYQNLKPWHVRVDVAEWGPNFTRKLREAPLTGGGTCKTKDSDAQVKICVRRVKKVNAIMELV